jgi:hypothetical protein
MVREMCMDESETGGRCVVRWNGWEVIDKCFTRKVS